MTTRFLPLTVIAALAMPAFAQTALPQGSASTTAAPGVPTGAATGAPKTVAVVTAGKADGRAPARAPGATSIAAAGSVIVLADGIVANATIAQILPPAPGFVYDR